MSRLLSWYGDDFSGSTDVMEALERNGISAVLFLRTPTDAEVAEFSDVRAIGIAGVSRSQTPEWMSEHLPPIFERLKEIGAPICHYKVCSTFDSAPHTGSIGRALDIGSEIFASKWVPMVVGAPILRRYTVFGNLFATVDGDTHRIDRHPTMSRHPVTPMQESDLRLHLSRQTDKQIGLLDILDLQSKNADDRLRQVLGSGAEIVLFDTLDNASLQEIGRLVWKTARHSQELSGKPIFAVASSGLEYALTTWWRASGDVPVHEPSFVSQAADRIIVVSGSCSPVTESQIRWALQNGFAAIPVNAKVIAEAGDTTAVLAEAESALAQGRSVILYTALGPSSAMMVEAFQTDGTARDAIGSCLGAMLRTLIQRSGVKRVVVAGGDTSGHAARQLDITALRMIRPLAPGSPLCRVCGSQSENESLEIVFKGGQVGGPDYFGLVRG